MSGLARAEPTRATVNWSGYWKQKMMLFLSQRYGTAGICWLMDPGLHRGLQRKGLPLIGRPDHQHVLQETLALLTGRRRNI